MCYNCIVESKKVSNHARSSDLKLNMEEEEGLRPQKRRRLVRRGELFGARPAVIEGPELLPQDKEEEVINLDDVAEDIRPEGQGVGTLTEGKDVQTARWLRSLTLEQSQGLWKVFSTVMDGKLSDKLALPESEIAMLRSLKAKPDTGRDGQWYASWSTCKVVTASADKKSHYRWQIDITAGARSVGSKVRLAIGDERWQALILLVSPARQVKLQAHHVAYNALSIRANRPLPLNCGTGGSISHPCDTNSCLVHLESTPVHKDNMDRQRCPGIILTCFRGFIIKETPCLHGMKLGGGERIQGEEIESESVVLNEQLRWSCTKIQLVTLSEGDFADL